MGECNDPNYGLSDEAVPAPGRPQQKTRLTEQVGKRNVLLGSLRDGGNGGLCLQTPATMSVFTL